MQDPFKELDKHLKYDLGIEFEVHELPILDKDPINWIKQARPVVDGMHRDIDWHPFWVDIYNDLHWDVMVLAGRQVFKTTYCTDILAWSATAFPSKQVAYIVDSQDHLSSMSNQRMRVGTFEENELLSLFPRHGTGNVGEISLRNHSTIYLLHQHGGYRKAEGKSPFYVVLDEAQYHLIEHLPKLESSLTQTHGKMRILGIGGEAGSAYEKLWNRTDQREWKYDVEGDYVDSAGKVFEGQGWRNGLVFDEDGFVHGKYMNRALAGRWIAEEPSHAEYHGYHIPQQMMPEIPLSKADAINLYKIAPKFSIEHKKEKFSAMEFTTHVSGGFFRSERRPITREMVMACMQPYHSLSLLTGDEVKELKKKYGSALMVTFGCDWGAGGKSKTVFCVLLFWRKYGIYQIAYIDARPVENLFDQARRAVECFNEYDCDAGVADLGYGTHQVKAMQVGGNDSKGVRFEGVGDDKLVGCLSGSDYKAPFKMYDAKTDAHGDEVARISMDKSAAIDEFIQMMVTTKMHPETSYAKAGERPILIIPYHNDVQYETDWLVDGFIATTRKDLPEDLEKDFIDSRTSPRKEYNHPNDAMMAIIYARQAANKYDAGKWKYISVG